MEERGEKVCSVVLVLGPARADVGHDGGGVLRGVVALPEQPLQLVRELRSALESLDRDPKLDNPGPVVPDGGGGVQVAGGDLLEWKLVGKVLC